MTIFDHFIDIKIKDIQFLWLLDPDVPYIDKNKSGIRIKKFITANSGKINKIYQRCGLLSRDKLLCLGEPYLTKKKVLSLKGY